MAKPVSTRRSDARLWIAAAVGVVLLAGAIALGWFLRSPYFADFVRRKLIVTLEDATGGKVDVASFQWKLSELAFQADDVTVHGLEPRDQLPYVHIDRVQVTLRILSFVGRRVNLDRLVLQHPVIHLIVYPDGSTNAPAAKVEPKTMQEAVQDLFDLAVAQADFRNGMLLLNERQVPLDFTANDVVAAMTYNKFAQRYDGHLLVRKADVKYQEFREVAAQAQVQFSILHNMAEVKSLKLTSEKSSIEASAKLADFNHPQLQVSYNSTVDVAQLGAVSRTTQLRSGTLLLDGTGAYSEAAGYTSQGRIAFRDLDYMDKGIGLRRAGLNANFSLQNNRLNLTRIAARALGGSITGDAEIKNLVALTPAPTAPMPPAQKRATTKKAGAGRSAKQATASAGDAMAPTVQEGSARLRISGLSLNEVASTLSTRALPLDKLNPVGSVNGTVNVSWKQSLAEALADLTLDVAAPASAGNQLSVNASLRGRYSVRASSINLTALDVRTPHSHVNASGTLAATSASLKLALDTTSLTEFQPLLVAMGNAPLPIELGGEAKFDGTLQGQLRGPQISGHLQATNFTYVYTAAIRLPAAPQPAPQAKRRSWLHLTSSPSVPPPAPTVPQPRRIHIDEFSGDLQYSKSGVALRHAAFQEGSSQFKLDGSTTLDRGNFTPASQFQLQGSTHNADVAELQRVAGFDYPVTGKLSLTLEAAGTQDNLRGHAQVMLLDGEAYGRPIKSLSTKAVFTNKSVELQDIHMKAGRGALSGQAAYDFSNRSINFDLNGESVDLDEFPELQHPRLRVEGVADFRAKGSGTLDEPVINGHLQVDKLVLNGDTIGALSADAVTHGRELKLTARSSFPQATFLLDGNVELRGDMPAQMNLKFTHLNIHPFLPAGIRNRITKEALLDGEGHLNGPLKQARLLNGTLDVTHFSVEIENVPVKSDGPIELKFAKQMVSVERFAVLSGDSHFVLQGTADLAEDGRLDLHASGGLDMKLAETLNPDVTSYGTANVDITVGGTAASPLMTGRVDILHAGLSMIDLPAGLGDLNGTLVFNRDRLEVQRLTARMGGGQVTFGGFVTYGRTLGFNLNSSGKDIRFRYAGISVTSDQDLRLTGTLENSTLSGDITVTRFAQIPSSDLQFLLAQAGAPARIPNPKSSLNNLHLDVRILSTPELTVQTTLAKLSGDVDLRLRGTAERPVLLGRINIAEGDIKLAGTKYHLERGDVTFLDPVRIDPVLDVEATTRVRDYDITIGLHGTLERLNTTYRSDPPLSSDDIVSLLAFGRTQQENAMGVTPTSGGLGANASGAILSEAINQTVTNRFSKIFGVSSIRINPSVGGPDNDPNARLTLEQQVSNNITLTYITNLARSAQEVIQFEYNINSEYTVQGIRDENGVVSFDLLIRKRKR